MGILRLLSSTMGKITTFRCYQIVLLLVAALAVMAFYYFGSEKQNFSSTTKRIKQQTQASHNSNRNDADLSADTRPLDQDEKAGVVSEAADHQKRSGGWRYYHALMMFTKIDKSSTLQGRFEVAMRSMVQHGHFSEDEVLVLHYVSDAPSKELGEKMLPELMLDATFQYEVVFHDVGTLTEKLFPIVEAMQKHFSAGSGAYYSDSIFFLSVAMHLILPAETLLPRAPTSTAITTAVMKGQIIITELMRREPSSLTGWFFSVTRVHSWCLDVELQT